MLGLPSVLPHDVGALQALLVARQKVMQALHQEAQSLVQAAQREVQAAQEQVLAAHQEMQAVRAQAQAAPDDAHAYILRMLEQAILARQRMFGASSEQMSAQSKLFDEAEVLAQSSTDAQDTAPIATEETQGTVLMPSPPQSVHVANALPWLQAWCA